MNLNVLYVTLQISTLWRVVSNVSVLLEQIARRVTTQDAHSASTPTSFSPQALSHALAYLEANAKSATTQAAPSARTQFTSVLLWVPSTAHVFPETTALPAVTRAVNPAIVSCGIQRQGPSTALVPQEATAQCAMEVLVRLV